MSDSLDINGKGVTTLLAKNLKADIDEYCQQTYDDGHRSHLGASLIGDPCRRKLWYVFRWVKHEKFSGRMYRLFNRGHREEMRFTEWLRGIGAQLWTHQEDGTTQIRINDCNGHFGGSIDGVIILPKRYGYDKPMLTEFKTNGTGSGFKKLQESLMPIAKPMHWAQTCTYGAKMGFEHVAYLNICKNDDDLHIEITKLDHSHGNQMIAKAESIIVSDIAPPKLSTDPTYYICKSCDFNGICHNGEKTEVNCRSCRFAKPVENAQWFCDKHNGTIPKEYIPQACGEYVGITDNV